MGRGDLTDEQWAVLEPLLPKGARAWQADARLASAAADRRHPYPDRRPMAGTSFWAGNDSDRSYRPGLAVIELREGTAMVSRKAVSRSTVGRTPLETAIVAGMVAVLDSGQGA